MANEKTPVVWDDDTKKHRPLGTGEKMGGLDASSIISSDSGNLIQTGSDGLALVTGSSLADPRADNLLETSGNGKLQVTSDRIAEWISAHPDAAGSLAAAFADGETIVASGGKLVVDPSTAPKAKLSKISAALRKAGAGLAVDASTGKLVVDFASMDPAIMRAVVLSMVQQGGGIGVDANGQLYVDFNSMPTDKFEAMLKSLKMLVPLDANKNIYVSTNNSAAGDTIIDGRGTAAKPFKTIQAAVNYAIGNYAVGNYHLNIRIVAGTYNENVTLPDFSRGSGYMALLPDSGARDVIVVAQTDALGTRGRCFRATGGYWRLYYMDARREEHPTTGNSIVCSCYYAGGGSTRLDLYGCAATQTIPASPSPLGGNNYDVRIFEINDGANMRLYHGTLAGSISAQKPSSGTPVVDVFSVERGASLWLVRDHDSENNPVTTPDISCSGSCDTFMHCWQGGTVNTYGGGTINNFTGAMSGKRYALYSGSYVTGTGSDTYFPGDAEGTVESSSYCWYA